MKLFLLREKARQILIINMLLYLISPFSQGIYANNEVIIDATNNIRKTGTNDILSVILTQGTYDYLQGELVPAELLVPDHFTLTEFTADGKTYTDFTDVKIPANKLTNWSAVLKPDPIYNATDLANVLNVYAPRSAEAKGNVVQIQEEISIRYQTNCNYRDTLIFKNTSPIIIQSTSRKTGGGPTFFLDGGDVTFSNCGYGPDITVESGSLTIEDGHCGGIISKGDNAQTTIKGGLLGIIRVEKGTVDISGGVIDTEINVLGGALNISGGYIHSLNVYASSDISLSGGYYRKNLIFIADDSKMDISSMIKDGFTSYTRDERIQPDVPMEIISTKNWRQNDVSGKVKTYWGKDISLGQIKPQQTISHANFEAAQSADVGENGKDVTVHGTEYLINTEKGLIWLAYMLNDYDLKQEDNKNGLTNGSDYFLPDIIASSSIQANFKLTGHIDMRCNWIPFVIPSQTFFDGQGYHIKNLNVAQSNAGFVLENNGTIANLTVEGNITHTTTAYTLVASYTGGIVSSNRGKIVNCSFIGNISTDIKEPYYTHNVYLGGLAGYSRPRSGSSVYVQNSQMTGKITCDVPTALFASNIEFDIGSVIGYADGTQVSNCFYKGTYPTSSINDGDRIYYSINSGDFIGKTSGEESTATNCEMNPTSETTLNDNVNTYNEAHPTASENTLLNDEDVIAWSRWKWNADNTTLIHENSKEDTPGPSLIETQIALLVKGDGELVATYLTRNDDPNKDPIEKTIEANTTVNIRNLVEFKITAKPGKGAELVKVTHTLGNQLETELEGIVANEPSKYDVSSLSTTITAYFRTETLYVDADTPFIGGAEGEIEEVEHINILDMGYSYEPVEKELGNVKVTAKGGEGTTTIDSHSHVILNLSGTSSLGKLLNQGTVVFRKKTAEATLEVKEVMNKGTLIDETGLITEVIADTYETILSLNGSQGDQVEVGEKATLRAKATVKADEPVRFQWQLWNGTEWKDVEGGSTIYPEVQTRSGSLRASDTDTYEDEYKTGVLTEGRTLQYRCLIITPFRDVPEETAVSTTLTTYAKVEVTPKSDPGINPDPTPTPSYTYYEVTLPEVTGATTNPAAGKYTVKEGDSFSFTLTLDADYDQSKPEVKAGSEVLTADANDTYTIANVPGDLTITITGIALNNPTANAEVGQTIKVWGEGTTLHIYTEKRETIRLYTFNGQLLRQMDNAGRISITNLPQGNYLIRIGSRTWKIAL